MVQKVRLNYFLSQFRIVNERTSKKEFINGCHFATSIYNSGLCCSTKIFDGFLNIDSFIEISVVQNFHFIFRTTNIRNHTQNVRIHLFALIRNIFCVKYFTLKTETNPNVLERKHKITDRNRCFITILGCFNPSVIIFHRCRNRLRNRSSGRPFLKSNRITIILLVLPTAQSYCYQSHIEDKISAKIIA